MYFNLLVKSLYAALVYVIIFYAVAFTFPERVPQSAFSDLGILCFFILIAFEFIFDFSKPGDK